MLLTEESVGFWRNWRKPIKCWKVVRKIEDGYYVPLFYAHSCEYRDGKTQSLSEKCVKTNGNYVEIGFHSYVRKEDALEDLNLVRRKLCDINARVIECEIPRLALYIKGFDRRWESYVSSKIKVIGEVKG